MFDHFGLRVRDMHKSLPFYEACLAPLGIRIAQRQPEFDAVIFSGEAEFPFMWMGSTKATWMRENHQPGLSPVHFAFPAPSRQAVNEFHRQGLANGGTDHGEPGIRDPGYYAAYLLDPDGNNVAAGYRE